MHGPPSPPLDEAAVVGGQDARWGELLVAFVVPEPRTDFDADAVTVYCRERLTPFKAPRSWIVVGELASESLVR